MTELRKDRFVTLLKKWEPKETDSNFLQYLFLTLSSDILNSIITFFFITSFSTEYFTSFFVFFLRSFEIHKPSPTTFLIYRSKSGCIQV